MSFNLIMSSERYGGSTVVLKCRTKHGAINIAKSLMSHLENGVEHHYDHISIFGDKFSKGWSLYEGKWKESKYEKT